MRYPTTTTIMTQLIEVHQEVTGSPEAKWTIAAITPAPAGIGIPTKYFLPGRPGLDGCGLLVMLKRANRLAPAIRNRKLAIAPSCTTRLAISAVENARNMRKPHIHPNMAGATPNVITSARESNSLPK